MGRVSTHMSHHTRDCRRARASHGLFREDQQGPPPEQSSPLAVCRFGPSSAVLPHVVILLSYLGHFPKELILLRYAVASKAARWHVCRAGDRPVMNLNAQATFHDMCLQARCYLQGTCFVYRIGEPGLLPFLRHCFVYLVTSILQRSTKVEEKDCLSKRRFLQPQSSKPGLQQA